jgi:hypothetical protein
MRSVKVDSATIQSFRPSRPFVPARGVNGGHAQTIFGHVARPRKPAPGLVRETMPTADGDRIVVERIAADPAAPHLLALHGLEGGPDAGYVRELGRAAAARGYGLVALGFRSCGDDNQLLRSYHGGDTGDALAVVAALRRQVHGPIVGVGFSLGGNVLVKLLADGGDEAPLCAGVAISAPLDLDASAAALDEASGLTTIYRNRFVRQMRKKALRKARRHAGPYDLERTRRARTLREFDDAWTAPVHGFGDVDRYYATCSSAAHLDAIRRPLLLLAAHDDPLVPGRLFPSERAARNPWLRVVLTAHGGHVGFATGSALRPRWWAEATAIEFVAHVVQKRL